MIHFNGNGKIVDLKTDIYLHDFRGEQIAATNAISAKLRVVKKKVHVNKRRSTIKIANPLYLLGDPTGN